MKYHIFFRRFLGWMLALVMVAAPITVFAAAEEESVQTAAEDALLVEKLEALGVIDVFTDDLGMLITKRQMANLIVRYLDMSSSGIAQGKTPFADVSPRDAGIDDMVMLYQAGIITGDENYNFHPDSNVTYNEVLVFIVNAVGHKLFAVRNGGYPEGYLRTAIQLDLLSDIKVISGKDAAPLRDIYRMLEAALEAGAVVEGSITGNAVDYYISDTEDFLSETYGIRTYKGVVTGNENTRLTTPDSSLTDEQIEIDGTVYDTPGYVYAASLGRSARYYLRDMHDGTFEAAYVEEDDKKNVVKRIDAEDLLPGKTTLHSIFYTDEAGKDKHIDFTDNITVIYNGKCYRGFGYLQNVLPPNGYIEALDNTGDGTCEILFVNTYQDIIVAAVDAYAGTITAKGTGAVYPVDVTDKDTKLYMHPENRSLELSKVRVGDVATIMESKGEPKLTTVYISRDKVSGMITEHSDTLGYMINGAYYKQAVDYCGPELTAGLQMTFCLDINGDIVDIDSSEVESDAAIGLVTGIDYDFDSVDDSLDVRIFAQDGELITYPVRFPVKINNRPYEKKDVNSVIELLSGGAQDGDGRYYVRDAYVVQFQLSGGGISVLNTGSNSSVGQLRIIGEGSSFFVRNGKMLGLEGASPSGYASFKPGETLIFACPSAGNLDEADAYGMLDKLTSDREYTTSVTQYYQIAIDGYVLYDFHNNDARVAEVILLKGKAPAGAEALSGGSSIGVITKFTNTVDEEGVVTKKVYTNVSDSAMFDAAFTYKKGADTRTLSASDNLSTYFKPGDVIRYGTNAKGLIESIEILTSFDAASNTMTKYFTSVSALGSSNASSNLVSGYVKYNDTKNGVITFTTSKESGATEYMINAEAPRVVCYHSKTEKASEESVSAIASGDNIVVRVETYYKAAEIVVCR